LSLIKEIKSNPHFAEIVKGGTTTFFTKIISVSFGLIANLIIARYYGAEALGLLTIVNSVIVLFALTSTFGVNSTIIRLIPEYKEKYSNSTSYFIFKKSFNLVLLFSVISGIVLYILTPLISVTVFSSKQLIYLLSLAAFFLVPQAIMAISNETLRALKKIKEFAFNQLLSSIVFLIILIILTALKFDLYNPIYAVFGSILFMSLIVVPSVFKSLKRKGSKSKISLRNSQIISIALPMFVISSVHLIIANIDIWCLGIMLTEEYVGIYSVAIKLTLFSSFILTAFNGIIAPKFSELFYSGQMNDLKSVAQNSSKLTLWITFPMTLILILFGKFILGFWGESFEIAYLALVMLAIGQLINVAVGSVGLFLEMTGNQKVFRNIVFVGGIINIVLNILLIPEYGIDGAAFASMISIGFWNIAASFYIKKKFNLSISYLSQIRFVSK